MRIALFGQAAFGKDVLDALRAADEEVVGVSTPAAGSRPDPLFVAAGEAGLPVIETPALRKQEHLDAFRAWGAELLVFAFVTDIVRKPVLASARLGAIQYHPSLLPRHRGRSSIAWPIISGEPTTGISIFWVDEGIDTGPVLLQREVPIGPEDTVGSLYFNQLYPMGVRALADAVAMVRAGTAPRVAQDEAFATYEPPLGPEHARVDFSRPAPVVFNHIRGCDPAPGASVTWNGESLRLFDAGLTQGKAPADPGTVVALEDGKAQVSVVGGTLRIGRVQRDGAPKVAAAEVLAVGDVLGGAS